MAVQVGMAVMLVRPEPLALAGLEVKAALGELEAAPALPVPMARLLQRLVTVQQLFNPMMAR